MLAHAESNETVEVRRHSKLDSRSLNRTACYEELNDTRYKQLDRHIAGHGFERMTLREP